MNERLLNKLHIVIWHTLREMGVSLVDIYHIGSQLKSMAMDQLKMGDNNEEIAVRSESQNIFPE